LAAAIIQFKRRDFPVIGTGPTIRLIVKLFGGLIEPQLKYELYSADILVEGSYDLEDTELDARILHIPSPSAFCAHNFP